MSTEHYSKFFSKAVVSELTKPVLSYKQIFLSLFSDTQLSDPQILQKAFESLGRTPLVTAQFPSYNAE